MINHYKKKIDSSKVKIMDYCKKYGIEEKYHKYEKDGTVDKAKEVINRIIKR